MLAQLKLNILQIFYKFYIILKKISLIQFYKPHLQGEF